MGGLKWLREQKGAALDIDELAPKPEPFNAAQKTTLLMVAILIILVVVPGPAWYERRISESYYQYALQRRFYFLRTFNRTHAYRLWRFPKLLLK